MEKAECKPPEKVDKSRVPREMYDEDEVELPIEKVSTPGKKTVEEVAAFLGIKPSKIVKTLIYKADEMFVAALVRGDHELNEIKLRKFLGVAEGISCG